MARFSQAKILRLLRQSDNATVPSIKGVKLEELVKYLFCKFSGIEHYKSNMFNRTRSQEIDVAFTNDTRVSDLYFLGISIITECKNTAHKTTSMQTGWFIRKVQQSDTDIGILVSLQGITGEGDDTNHAYGEISSAMTEDGTKILVIRRADILSFQTTDDMSQLIQRKLMKLGFEREIV